METKVATNGAPFEMPALKPDFVDSLIAYCREKGYPLTVEMTDYGLVAHSEENRENPCFLCSRRRRQRLFELADEFGCNKIAFGHNKDDIIETLFLNMCYAGEISTMSPVQTFFKDRFTVIRPLAFTDEDVIRRFATEAQFPDFENNCPSAKKSKRQEIKVMLQQLYRGNRKIKGNLFRAMQHLMQNGKLK